MKKSKNNFLSNLIQCWQEVSISDKALIILMSFLLVPNIYNLFIPESTGANSLTINLAIRASIASIFGYFLSENFLKNKTKNKNSKTGSKGYICNKTIQILIALIVCTITLISLIIANNINILSSEINPTVIQFRDLIGNCIGFLLGHSSSSIKNNSSNN